VPVTETATVLLGGVAESVSVVVNAGTDMSLVCK